MSSSSFFLSACCITSSKISNLSLLAAEIFSVCSLKYFQGGVPRHHQTEVLWPGEQQQTWLCGWSVRQAVGQSQGQSGWPLLLLLLLLLGHPAQVQVALSPAHLPGLQLQGGEAEQHHLPSGQGQQRHQHWQDQGTQGGSQIIRTAKIFQL